MRTSSWVGVRFPLAFGSPIHAAQVDLLTPEEYAPGSLLNTNHRRGWRGVECSREGAAEIRLPPGNKPADGDALNKPR